MESKHQKSDEVIDFIQKLGSRIDKTTLEQNEPDTIIELYAFLMEKLGIIKKENLKIEFEAMPIFAYNNLHNRPIYIIKLFNYMNGFLTPTLSIDNFTTEDLFNPNVKRTRKILSAIIKFFKFKLGEKEFNDLAKETTASSEIELLQAKESLQKAHETLEQLHKLKDSERSEIERITLAIAELKKDKNGIDSQITIKDEEVNKLNDTIKEYNDKISIIDQMQNTYLNSIRSLKSQIVSSPGKMQSVLNETQNQIDLLNKEINEKEALCQSFEKNLNNFELLSRSLKEYYTTVIDLDKIKMSSEELSSNIKDKKGSIEMKNKVIQENEDKIEKIQSQIDNYQQYINDNYQKNKNIQINKEAEVAQLKLQLYELNEVMNNLDAKVSMSNDTIKSYEGNIQELALLKNDYEKHIEEEMETIYASVKEYSFKFEKILDHFAK